MSAPMYSTTTTTLCSLLTSLITGTMAPIPITTSKLFHSSHLYSFEGSKFMCHKNRLTLIEHLAYPSFQKFDSMLEQYKDVLVVDPD